jgi:hypothetical protein
LQKNRKTTDKQGGQRQTKNAINAAHSILMFVFSHQKVGTLISDQPVFK